MISNNSLVDFSVNVVFDQECCLGYTCCFETFLYFARGVTVWTLDGGKRGIDVDYFTGACKPKSVSWVCFYFYLPGKLWYLGMKKKVDLSMLQQLLDLKKKRKNKNKRASKSVLFLTWRLWSSNSNHWLFFSPMSVTVADTWQ